MKKRKTLVELLDQRGLKDGWCESYLELVMVGFPALISIVLFLLSFNYTQQWNTFSVISLGVGLIAPVGILWFWWMNRYFRNEVFAKEMFEIAKLPRGAGRPLVKIIIYHIRYLAPVWIIALYLILMAGNMMYIFESKSLSSLVMTESIYSNGDCGLAPNEDLFNSYYLTGMAATTVGFGDVAPCTPGGRVCAIIASTFGIVLYAIATATVLTAIKQSFPFSDSDIEEEVQAAKLEKAGLNTKEKEQTVVKKEHNN